MTVAGFRQSRLIRAFTLVLVAIMARTTIVGANDIILPAPPPPRPPILGFVDTHLHQFANLGFGGLEVWGSPMDPLRDLSASDATAATRALPNSDFVYVSAIEALDYLYIAGVPAVATPLAQSCDSGSCWPECPAGTGVSGNACVRIEIHGTGGGSDLLNKMVPHGNSTGHGTFGYPDMNGWPAFDVHTTQQAYWEWLKRAHKHGMRLMVMLAVNNSVLCQLAMHRNSLGCSDDGSVERQVQGAKDLEAYIDARAETEADRFYRIVYNAEQARTAMQAGKLAVVLGTEVDTLWGCTPGAAHCTNGFIEDKVGDYHDMGIRVVYPVHLIDNKFGGAAPYTGLFEVAGFVTHGNWMDLVACDLPIEWRSDIRQTIQDAKTAVDIAVAAVIASAGLALPLLDAAVQFLLLNAGLLTTMLPLIGGVLGPAFGALAGLGPFLTIAAAIFIQTLPGTLEPAEAGYCNRRTLTAEGTTLINELMDHKMIIDVDHTDGNTFDAILDIAEARHYPGIVSGHTGLVETYESREEAADAGVSFDATESGRHEGNKTNAQVTRIMNLGGFLSLGILGGNRGQLHDYSTSDAVAFNCGRSSQAFAQSYLYATKTLGLTAVGFGSDINGFAGLPTPRYGSKACQGDYAGYDPESMSGRLDYANARDYKNQLIGQYSFGNKTWDYNTDGFAHTGLYPDFLADLKTIGLTDAELAPIFGAAEAYVRMWEKVDDDEDPTVRCGSVGTDWHDANVAVPCLSFDFGWGLANAADANFSLSTTVNDDEETANASTVTHAAICDKEFAPNCTEEIPAISGIRVDRKDPSVVVTTPADLTPTYILNSVINADYACSDGGSGVATCAGPVATASPISTTIGAHTFTVTGADNVGHVVNVDRPYNVTFAICAQYDQTAAHRVNSTVPIKIRLCDATGANVSAAAIVLTATGVTQISTSAAGVLEDAGNSNPDDRFRFVSGGEYIFNLKTTGLSRGTYALTFTATGDPIPHQVQFQVR